MKHDLAQDIALMRYSMISPLIIGLPNEYDSKEAYFRAASERGAIHPNGSTIHPAPTSIKRWYQHYQKNGFDGLLPASRSDQGTSRKIDPDLEEQIKHLKATYPRMSAAAIFRQLCDNGSTNPNELSESTVNRFLNNLALKEKMTNNKDMRRYERPHVNEVWCGDSSVGPYLKTQDGKKHKVYVIALIDDASRYIVGIDVFFNDNFVNLMSVMKSAVAKFGIPKLFNFDNGSSYKNKQMDLLAARIGSTVHYDQPYTPTQKAKVERWFRTMKDQWMASLDMRDFHTLDELRGSLHTYVNQYNQSIHSSLNGKSPQERYFSEPNCFHRLDEDKIDKLFLLELERRVSIDSVVTIDHIEYEVDYLFVKQRFKLRYSPDMQTIYVVETDGTLTPIRLLNKTENAHIKREKPRLCGGEE